ncbi:MAG: Fis family transcriptional regulator, partial [Myxococcaceae bacterium]|nr:Fis family transcriptional regulator [Myxococcaceae bacterium]
DKMNSKRKTVVLGLLGTVLDAGKGPQRWERWRPTVDVCRHEDLVIDRLELLYDPRWAALSKLLATDIAQVSPETEVRTHAIEFGDAWAFEQVYATLFGWVRSYRFEPEREQYLVHITTGTHVAQICWFLLTESRHIPGRLLQASPPPAARDRSQPGRYGIIDLDLSRYDAIARRFAQETSDSISLLKAGIATQNPAFNQLIEQIELVARSSTEPILLMGPTGAGKSQLARRIFELKRERQRLRGALVEVNCATLRGDAALSALFGHVKGAYTGAQADRAGYLRAAHEGVLFLDEIGELTAEAQAMLLRALEDKSFLPVGSDRPARSEFQLIAGTNRELQMGTGTSFRDDLLARINLWTFSLPGLSARPEDLEPNLEYELDAWEQRHGTRVTINREARELFLDFARGPEALWLGSFRDFNAAVTRMATLAPGGRIDVATVQDELQRLRSAWRGAKRGGGQQDPLPGLLAARELAALDAFDRVQLAEVVRVCREARSLSDAGRTLFAASRAQKARPNDADRLRKYLARFGLSFEAL